MTKPKMATSYRLTKDAQHLLNALAERLGLSKTAVLEMAIRKLAAVEMGDHRAEPRQIADASYTENQSSRGG